MRSPAAIARSFFQTLNLVGEVGATEVYRAQARRARDPKTAGVFREIQAHEATHACEARARVDASEPVRRAVEAAARAGGSVLGTITSIGGDRAALAFDYGLERLFELGYRASIMLLPSDARSSERRVLKRALAEEREHQALIRDRLGI